MTQKLDCRYCGTNLGYLKGIDVYEVRPGENQGPFPRTDDKGNPVSKKEVKKTESSFRLSDRFQKLVTEQAAQEQGAVILEITAEGLALIEVPGSITCGGCGQENPIY